MKNRMTVWFAQGSWLLVLAAMAIACNDVFSPDSRSAVKATLSSQSNAEIVMASQDVLDIAGAGMTSQGIDYGRVAEEDDSTEMDEHLCGAVVTKSVTMLNAHPDSLLLTGTIIIDFGDGTNCPDSSHRRTGTITTEFTISVNLLNHRAWHSVETVTLNNFSHNGKTISGTFIAEAAPGGLQWLRVQNAALHYNDSVDAEVTWNGELTITRDNGGTISRDDDTKTIEGSVTGTVNDASFTSAITSALIVKWECYHGRNIPVQGTIDITSEGAVTTLNFGDGTCDKLYTSTSAGVSTDLHF